MNPYRTAPKTKPYAVGDRIFVHCGWEDLWALTGSAEWRAGTVDFVVDADHVYVKLDVDGSIRYTETMFVKRAYNTAELLRDMERSLGWLKSPTTPMANRPPMKQLSQNEAFWLGVLFVILCLIAGAFVTR